MNHFSSWRRTLLEMAAGHFSFVRPAYRFHHLGPCGLDPYPPGSYHVVNNVNSHRLHRASSLDHGVSDEMSPPRDCGTSGAFGLHLYLCLFFQSPPSHPCGLESGDPCVPLVPHVLSCDVFFDVRPPNHENMSVIAGADPQTHDLSQHCQHP